MASYPDAHPLFHSDRGFQYTNAIFHEMLTEHGMTQSMSRVGKCIDNGPIEGFRGILKRECYYGKRFESREDIVDIVVRYILENEEEKINELSSYLVKKIDE